MFKKMLKKNKIVGLFIFLLIFISMFLTIFFPKSSTKIESMKAIEGIVFDSIKHYIDKPESFAFDIKKSSYGFTRSSKVNSIKESGIFYYENDIGVRIKVSFDLTNRSEINLKSVYLIEGKKYTRYI